MIHRISEGFANRGERKQAGFTLIELLVVIAIIAVLAIVVVLTLNPAQLLQQSRDADRFSDLANLQSAVSLFQTDQPAQSLGTTSLIYVSIPDPTATSTAGDQCQGLGLPAAPTGYAYQCAPSSTYRSINGTGWLPLNFSLLSSNTPLSLLPIDPINQTSSGFYYTYVTNGSQYEVTSLFESQKYKSQYGQAPIVTNYPEVNAKGSSLAINPLWSTTGLVGYWPLNEGTGSTTQDFSGAGSSGTWNGSTTAGSYYTGSAKIPAYAGVFDGATTYVNVATSTLSLSTNFSLSFWANFANVPVGSASLFIAAVNLSSASLNLLCGYIESSQNIVTCAGNQSGTSFPQANFALPTVNTWAHYVLTYDGSNMRSYLNGVLKQSPSAALTTAPVTNFTIGKAGTWFAGTGYMNGSIDDVRLYNRALSAAEIQALYTAQK